MEGVVLFLRKFLIKGFCSLIDFGVGGGGYYFEVRYCGNFDFLFGVIMVFWMRDICSFGFWCGLDFD